MAYKNFPKENLDNSKEHGFCWTLQSVILSNKMFPTGHKHSKIFLQKSIRICHCSVLTDYSLLSNSKRQIPTAKLLPDANVIFSSKRHCLGCNKCDQGRHLRCALVLERATLAT